MSTNFPISLDNGTSLPYPSSGNLTNSPSLASGQDNQNDSLIAIQNKLGITASTPTASNLLIGTGVGTSTWSKLAPTGLIVGTTDTQTLTNKTLTSPTITGAILTNANITTDLITGFTTNNSGTIFGVPVTTGVIQTANTVNGSSLVAGSLTASQIANATITPGKMNWTTFPRFYGYSTVGANTGTSMVIIKLNNATYDNFSKYNTSTGVYTIPVAGWYYVTGNVAWAGGTAAGQYFWSAFTDSTATVEIVRGLRFSGSGSTAGTFGNGYGSTAFITKFFNVNDTVALTAISSPTSSLDVSAIGNVSMSIQFISS